MSVRKRVVKIFREVLIQRLRTQRPPKPEPSSASNSPTKQPQEEYPRTAELCIYLIRRIQDEETVRRLVLDVFQQLWFVPIERNASQVYTEEGDITASIGSLNFENELYGTKMQNRVQILMDVVCILI